MNIKEIETISYEEAAALLGLSKNTLYGGTARGILTPLPRRARKPGTLAKKQVELFVGKGLSLALLSPEEAVIWQEINQAIKARPVKKSSAPAETVPTQDMIAFAGAFIEGVADIALVVVDDMLNALQSGNLTPDDLVKFVKKSPAFRRLTGMINVDFDTLSEEDAQALNDMAYATAERVQMKFLALLARHAMQGMADKLPAPVVEQAGGGHVADAEAGTLWTHQDR